MSGISTALLARFIYQPPLELRDLASEGRVPADSVVVAVDVVECFASCFVGRSEDLRVGLGLEP